MPVAAKVKIATELAASAEQHADSKSFWKEMRQKYGMETRTLQKILSEKDELAVLVQKRPLTSTPLARSSGKQFLKRRQRSRYKGFRKLGAGRKAKWPDVQKDLKLWSEEQRAYGHSRRKKLV